MTDALDVIGQGDCIEGMQRLNEGSVDLVFADPPFNIGYSYDVYDDRQSYEHYLDWSKRWMQQVHRVLKPSGTFWLAIGDEYAAELKVIAQRELGFTTRSWVIWYYTFGVNCTKKFNRSHAHLFHFVKDSDSFTFNDEPIRVPSARQLVYGDARANPRGRLPDDTWILRPQDAPDSFQATEDTWYFPRVAGTFKERAGFHGCQMPEQLLGRIIRCSSNEGELVMDPFTGSGTTLAVAKKLGRRWLGFELSKEYQQRAEQRLAAIKPGDALNGSEQPLKPARTKPRQTSKATNRSVPIQPIESSATVRLATKRPPRFTDDLLKAFRECHGGASPVTVVTDPKLNAAFLRCCRKKQIPGDPVTWNASLLSASASRRCKEDVTDEIRLSSLRDRAPLIPAVEIALATLGIQTEAQILTMLADPQLGGAFEEGAKSLAPGRTSKAVLRLTAYWLTRDVPEKKSVNTGTASNQSKIKTQPAVPVAELNAQNEPGLYIVRAGLERRLYVGFSLDLKKDLKALLSKRSLAFWKKRTTNPRIDLATMPGASASELQTIKAQWVTKYKPPLNLSFPAMH